MDQENKLNQILELFGNRYDEKRKFYHILDEVAKHPIKIARLKENEDREGHLKEEVADLYLLSKLLIILENVDEKTTEAALDHFAEKIKEIYS